jgi:hypothetical protein
LFMALRVFTQTRMQAVLAFLVALCAVPLKSLSLLPAFLLEIKLPNSHPGLTDFVAWSSDGFFHGIASSPLVTFGTGTTLLAMSLIALYLQTSQERYLQGAALTMFLSAIVHPFEVFVMAPGAGLALLWCFRRRWKQGVRRALFLGLCSALGVFPFALLAWRHPWVWDAAQLNHWSPGSPDRLLLMLGLPAILGLVCVFMKGRENLPGDVLLKCWFGVTLIGIYVPFIPWSQHLFDGFHYATALLVVRQAAQMSTVRSAVMSYRRLAATALAGVCVLSLTPHFVFRLQDYRDGNAPHPELLFSTVIPKDEIAVIAWLRTHAKPTDLVLGSLETAAWLATVPNAQLCKSPLVQPHF